MTTWKADGPPPKYTCATCGGTFDGPHYCMGKRMKEELEKPTGKRRSDM